MALILPLLLLFLFGIIDFGRMLNTQITLTEAAREAARAVSLGYEAEPRIAAAANGLVLSDTDVTACAGDDLTADATVLLTYAYQPVTPIGSIMQMVGGTGDGAVTITARGVMPCVG